MRRCSGRQLQLRLGHPIGIGIRLAEKIFDNILKNLSDNSKCMCEYSRYSNIKIKYLRFFYGRLSDIQFLDNFS